MRVLTLKVNPLKDVTLLLPKTLVQCALLVEGKFVLQCSDYVEDQWFLYHSRCAELLVKRLKRKIIKQTCSETAETIIKLLGFLETSAMYSNEICDFSLLTHFGKPNPSSFSCPIISGGITRAPL